MKISAWAAVLAAVVGVFGAAENSVAQTAVPTAPQNPLEVRVATATPAAATAGKFKFILFWKQDDVATRAMADALKKSIATRADRAEWSAVNVTDATQRPVVDRFHVERAPMPMVLCLAPNGAITGGMPRQITEQQIDAAIVTPAMAEAAKALQDKRIIVICVKRDARQPMPAGAAEFMADPMFKDRTTAVNVALGDATEARFVTELEVKPEEVGDAMSIVIAPPGALVGKFPANMTAAQIGAALHAAGKCCNDPNCKHNQKKGQ